MLAALAGCGDAPITVDLVAPGQPVYFEGTIDGRAWNSITGVYDGAHTNYSIAIDGDFELTMVCEHRDGAFVAGQVYGTVDDAVVTLGTWNVPDCTEVADPPARVDVTGMLARQGILAIGDTTMFVTDLTVPFHIAVTPGVHDIAFTTTNYVVAIVHDQQFTGATDLGYLTFDSAMPMVTNSYGAPLQTSETATAFTQVDTRNGTTMHFGFDPSEAVFVPAAQLAYGDTQTFYFGAQGNGTQRIAIENNFATSPDQFELLGLLGKYLWNPTSRAVTWTPTSDYFSTLVISFTSDEGMEVATASKQWLDAHDPTAIAFDEAGPPNFVWRTKNPTTQLTLEQWTQDLTLLSSTGLTE